MVLQMKQSSIADSGVNSEFREQKNNCFNIQDTSTPQKESLQNKNKAKNHVLNWLRSSIFVAILLFLGNPLSVMAVYPPMPTQFQDFTDSSLIVTDEHGHAMVAYGTSDGHINTYYFADNVWNFLPLNSAIGFLSGLVMEPSGAALLTYRESSTGDLRSYSFDGSAWNVPATDPIDTSIGGSSLAINASGLAVTAWSDSSNDIRVSFFSNGNWGPISAPGAIGIGFSPRVEINANGDLVVAWQDVSGAILVNHYINGAWSAVPTTIEANGFLSSVGIADNGKSLVAFRQDPSLDIFASYFTAGVFNSTTMLNPPQPFTPANFGLTLEMAPNGTAVAAWQYNQTFFVQFDLYYAQFDGNTWAPAVNFQTGINGTEPTVSLNSSGDALIMWGNGYDFPNPLTYLTAELPVGGVLTGQQVVYTSTRSNPRSAAVSLADNGFNALAWSEDNPGDDASIPYGLAAVLAAAPQGLSGSVCSNKFVSQKDFATTITWDPSTDPTIVSYNLQRDGVLIANIPANGPLIYRVQNRCRTPSVYTLSAVDVDGIPGIPVSIVVN